MAIVVQCPVLVTNARKEAGKIMNLGQKTNSFIVGLACFGLLMQTTPSFAGPPVRAESTSSEKPVPKKVVQPAAIDVAMAKDGTISGRVLDAEQNGVAKTEVSIRQGKMEVAKTVTDADGRFEIANVKGGVYVVAANSGYGLFRFWTAKSAPPKSHEKVLLMSNSVVVRAQNANDGGEVLYDDNGQPYAKIHVVDHGAVATGPVGPAVGADLGSLDIFTIALLATAAAGLAVAIIALDDDDPAPASP
ncbi:hypothetical protein LBMAG52_31740 [Planctomycetia bacterium]|nr:hypothetical protein LBMAG52_31740 [Planctomycetia bacterium]